MHRVELPKPATDVAARRYDVMASHHAAHSVPMSASHAKQVTSSFPRGYTESLEERVRALENEVKELKDLLDEKDEKIDILSKIQSNSPSLRRLSSTHSMSPDPPNVKEDGEASAPKEDTFRVQQSPCLLQGEEPHPYFMGASSGRSFVGR